MKTLIAQVIFTKSYYMVEGSQTVTVLHTVEAENEMEAEGKIINHYKKNESPYDVYISVESIEFAEHIN